MRSVKNEMPHNQAHQLLKPLQPHQIIPLGDQYDCRLQPVIDHWRSLLSGDQLAPMYKDLDLLHLVEYLANAAILEISESGADIYYRYYGNNVAQMTGFDPTGKRMSDYSNFNLLEKWLPIFRQVAETCSPFAYQAAFDNVDKGHVVVQNVLAPFCRSDGRVSCFLSYAIEL
jgi:hypothetical protein